MYKISVIIPVYNREKLICNALESFLNSSFKDIEAIIIDDGSIDKTVYNVTRYCKEYNNISLIKSQHKGPGYTRNLGLKAAKGEYITFLDSDDTVPPEGYFHLYNTAKEKNADIVIGQLLRKIDNFKWYPYPFLEEFNKLNQDKNIIENYDCIICQPALWNKLFKKELIIENNINFYPFIMFEDLLFCLETFMNSQRVYSINEVVYCYKTLTKNSNSICFNPSLEIVKSGFEGLNQILKIMPPEKFQSQHVLILENNFLYLLERIWKLEDKKILFNLIKNFISHYKHIPFYNKIFKKIFSLEMNEILNIDCSTFYAYHELISIYKKQRNNFEKHICHIRIIKNYNSYIYMEGESFIKNLPCSLAKIDSINLILEGEKKIYSFSLESIKNEAISYIHFDIAWCDYSLYGFSTPKNQYIDIKSIQKDTYQIYVSTQINGKKFKTKCIYSIKENITNDKFIFYADKNFVKIKIY